MDLQGIYRKELKIAKRAYYRKRVQALRSSNPKSWYKNIKQLIGEDTSKDQIEVEAIKDLSDQDQCELIADKFAETSNLYEPLQRDQIESPSFSAKDIPVITEANVLKVLKALDTSKSRLNIPMRDTVLESVKLHLISTSKCKTHKS